MKTSFFSLPLLLILGACAAPISTESPTSSDSGATDKVLADVAFQRFEGEWLQDHSAESSLNRPAAIRVDSLQELTRLPLSPDAIDLDAFRNFDFAEESLIFVIHPELKSSASQLSVQALSKTTEGFAIDSRVLDPEPECIVPADLALLADVVAVKKADLSDDPVKLEVRRGFHPC